MRGEPSVGNWCGHPRTATTAGNAPADSRAEMVSVIHLLPLIASCSLLPPDLFPTSAANPSIRVISVDQPLPHMISVVRRGDFLLSRKKRNGVTEMLLKSTCDR